MRKRLTNPAKPEFDPSRRSFLIGSTAAGVTLAFGIPGGQAAASDAAANNLFDPTIWFTMDTDGNVVVNIIRAEMGQHVGTAIARIVADELEADWDKVSIHHVDSDPKWGMMVTGGSWSVWQSFDPMSRAGAAGRIELIKAGAQLMGVDPGDCVARNHEVRCGDKAIGYGEIVSKASFDTTYSAEDLAALTIKPASERRLIGKPSQQLDIPGKVDGTAVYGIDAEVEGMVYARPLLPPTRYQSSVKSIDDSAAKSIKGYQQTLKLEDPTRSSPGWAVVIADSFHAADKAAKAVKVEWNAGPTADVSEERLFTHASSLMDDEETGSLVVADEGVDGGFENAAATIEQTYHTNTVLHFQMEPVNALAYEKDGMWEIHTGNQWQSLNLPIVAQALGVDESKVVMRTYRLGGGFGRRLNGDYAVPAALASKALGKPVKLVFTRPDDARFDSVRSPSVQKLRMAFNEDKSVAAMEHVAAAGWPTQELAPGFMPKGKNGVPYDPFSISGADHWYNVGEHRVRAIMNDLANDTFRPGWLRSVGPGWTNWALESFIDEAAHSQDLDPVEFRLSMLDATGKNAGEAPNSVGGASRQAEVVRRAAKRANWGKSMGKNQGMGIATSFGQERNMPTWTACIAEVTVDPESGKVTVDKLTVVTDAGTVVSPDGALAQVEGASLWGLSMALHEGTRIANGEVADTNLDTYSPLRISDVPEMDIAFVESTATAVGLGEPATTVVAPAIANAIFNATGARVRELPMTPDRIKAAMS